MLFIIFLFLSFNAYADEIEVIDANTFTKTVVMTVKISDVKAKIDELQSHQAKIKEERDAIIAQDQVTIDDLKASLDAVNDQLN